MVDERANRFVQNTSITYIVLNNSLYSSSPLFSLISESSLSISSLSINRNDPRAAYVSKNGIIKVD